MMFFLVFMTLVGFNILKTTNYYNEHVLFVETGVIVFASLLGGIISVLMIKTTNKKLTVI